MNQKKTRLKYRDLTHDEIIGLTNGCGGKGGFINPPDFFFKASCNQHDFYYWRGHKESDRRRADWAFYKIMLVDIRENIRNHNIFNRFYYLLIATLYFGSVRAFGRHYFSYSDNYKTKTDLKKRLKELSAEEKVN